jgi:hypothetical protein
MGRGLAATLVLAMGGSGCLFVRPNPERSTCLASCVRDKNACLLEASRAAQLETCDDRSQECQRPCLALPDYAR